MGVSGGAVQGHHPGAWGVQRGEALLPFGPDPTREPLARSLHWDAGGGTVKEFSFTKTYLAPILLRKLDFEIDFHKLFLQICHTDAATEHEEWVSDPQMTQTCVEQVGPGEGRFRG